MSVPPPYNPQFNASDFVTATESGFSKAQSDLRYLQLATPSIATAGQTFDGGIFTDQLYNVHAGLSQAGPKGEFRLGNTDITRVNAIGSLLIAKRSVVKRDLKPQQHYFYPFLILI